MAMILESDKAGVRIQIREKKGIHVATESFPIYSPFFLLFNKTKTTQPNHLSDGDWKTPEQKKTCSLFVTILRLNKPKDTKRFCVFQKQHQTQPNQTRHVFYKQTGPSPTKSNPTKNPKPTSLRQKTKAQSIRGSFLKANT